MASSLLPVFDSLLLTRDLPGIGGRIKGAIEDFVVDELPLYPLAGSGEHTFVKVEKRGISTYEAIRRLCRALGANERDVGHAGMKDAHAVTTQWLSFERVTPERALSLELPKLQVLEATRHHNKLRKGHLAGNRFRCVIRDVDTAPEAETRAGVILERLRSDGVPNYFGPQRFGDPPRNHVAGRAMVRGEWQAVLDGLLGPTEGDGAPPELTAAREHYAAGDYDAALTATPERLNQERRLLKVLRDGGGVTAAMKSLPKKLKQLFVNAYQSALFNRLLAERLAAGTLGVLQVGDIAYWHERDVSFLVEDADAEQPRCARGEISPSGPLFGTKVRLGEAEPGRREQALLDAEGISPESFRLPGGLTQQGERRPFRFPLRDAELAWNTPKPGACTVSFTLGRGCYATNVLAELTRQSAAGDDGDGDNHGE